MNTYYLHLLKCKLDLKIQSRNRKVVQPFPPSGQKAIRYGFKKRVQSTYPEAIRSFI